MLRNKTSNTSENRPWRDVCRALAQERAQAEALVAWEKFSREPLFQHRWEHVQHVVALALHLAAQTGADPETVEAAAWLHDICKMEPNHAERGAVEAEPILATTDFPSERISAVVAAIRQHEGLFRPEDAPPLEPLAAAVLWDADKLSKIGVQALAFSLSTSRSSGRTLGQRRVRTEPFVQDVLSRTVTSMNTAPARKMAQQRYAAMTAALAAWAQEESESTLPAHS